MSKFYCNTYSGVVEIMAQNSAKIFCKSGSVDNKDEPNLLQSEIWVEFVPPRYVSTAQPRTAKTSSCRDAKSPPLFIISLLAFSE